MFLIDETSGREYQVAGTSARIGREPGVDVLFPDSETVVSGVHARVWRDETGQWWLEDLGSTNGTWLDGRRLEAPVRVASGARFSLGQRGPVLRVRLPGEVPATRREAAVDPDAPELRLRRVNGGEDLRGRGREIVIGRAVGCTIPLRTVVDTVVSKHHAMVEFDEAGNATITDLGSRNGTYVNGQPITGRAMLKAGDRIMFGWTGPLFEVRVAGVQSLGEMDGAPYHPELQPPKTFVGMVQSAEESALGARGLTRLRTFAAVMLRQMARESSTAFRVATLAITVVALGLMFQLYRVTLQRTSEAEQRLANAERALQEQLRSSQEAQRQAGEEIVRLRRELNQARRAAVGRRVVDSLERLLREAQAAARPALDAAGFERVAQENGRSIGMVIVRFAGGDTSMGSGFAITQSGFFVTNRHVVQPPGRFEQPVSVEIIMADTNVAQRAVVVTVSAVDREDVAVLKIRGFRGQPVRAINWSGRNVQQGMPAAVLGFPLGTRLGVDQRGFVRSSIFTGVISQTGEEWIRFSGLTFEGVSGSPVFNARGEVIAVHFGALSQGSGLGFSVPMSRVRRWLPQEARLELGL